MTDIDLIAPVEPYELERRLRAGMESLVDRVAARSVIRGRGSDLLLRVYMAGIYHGARLSETRYASQSQDKP